MIASEDRVTYAEARLITGRSHRYLRQQAAAGLLSRDGGSPREVFDTWLSRAECEELGLRRYQGNAVNPQALQAFVHSGQ